MIKNLFFLSLFMFSFYIASSQVLETKLYGNKEYKTWVCDNNSSTQYLGDACTGDILIYTFAKKENDVQKKECLNGRFKTSILTWEIKKIEKRDILIISSKDGKTNEEFMIDFLNRKGKTCLRLRTIVNLKTEKVNETIFYEK